MKKFLKMNEHIVALTRNKIRIPKTNESNKGLALSIQANLMHFKYLFSTSTIDALAKAPVSFLNDFNKSVTDYLKYITGDGNYSPIYNNFPKEVMGKSDAELLYNQISYYMSNGSWVPSSERTMSVPIEFETCKYTVITDANEAEFDKIFTDIVSVNQSITPSDMEIVKYFVESGRDLKFPDTIPFKENLCVLAAMGLDVPVKTPTDVLRIAVHLSGGDISLPAIPDKNKDRSTFRFKKFPRRERKMLLSLMEKCGANAADMVSRSERWIRLGEIIHPGEYRNRFPQAFSAFDKIRKGVAVSWHSRLNKALRKGYGYTMNHLSERPGELLRRVDFLFRRYPSNINDTCRYLKEACVSSSNKVLYELFQHFQKRTGNVKRSIMIKGARKRTPLPDLTPFSQDIVDKVSDAIKDALKTKFSTLESLGRVYIDPLLRNVPIPTNMRSLNLSLNPTVRGTRIPFENPFSKVIRAYVHWNDKNGSIDLDLSATFFSPNGNTGNLSFHSAGLKHYKSCHSGDVRHRRGKCAEYIDIDIADALSHGYEYVVLDVRNYNGGSLGEVNASAGYMEREFPESGKIWTPKTLAEAMKLQSSSVGTYISIIDLKSREHIFLDIDSESRTASGDKGIESVIDSYAKPPVFSVYDLLELHALGRGEIVDEKENALTIFEFDQFSKDYIRTAQYMGI